MAESIDKCSVCVAVRIQPQSVNQGKDDLGMCAVVALSRSQVAIGEDKVFSFDHVFDEQTKQEEVFERCVKQLVEGTFEGYNATILAYGQTGSGKTFTMGTSSKHTSRKSTGIIPRAAEYIFNGIDQMKIEAKAKSEAEPLFEVVVQFIEEIIDLLANGKLLAPIRIVENLLKAEISLNGASNIPVNSAEEMMKTLHKGVKNRTTMATDMNQTSSRSHAIFSVFVKQTRDMKNDSDLINLDSSNTGIEVLYSKLHFVDLAGSERLKKTGATGDRAKEGISINSGLLALGNVISTLGTASKGRLMHVPYRDSKLTRLLQDSLGGNSRTLMIACVSSNFSDYAETLSTLQYANRAKNIKNKVVVNQEKKIVEPKINEDVVVVEVEPKRLDGCFTADDWFKELEDVVLPESPSSLHFESSPKFGFDGPYDNESIQKMRDFYSKRMTAYQEHISVAKSAADALRTTILQRLCVSDLNKKKVGQLWMELQEVKAENKLLRAQNEDFKRKNEELERQLTVHQSIKVPIKKNETKEQQHGFQGLRAGRRTSFNVQCLPDIKPCHVTKTVISCNQFAVPEIKNRRSNKLAKPSSNGASSGIAALSSDGASSRSAVRGQVIQRPETTRRSRSVGSVLRDQSPQRMFHNVRAYFEGKSKRRLSTNKNLQQQYRF